MWTLKDLENALVSESTTAALDVLKKIQAFLQELKETWNGNKNDTKS